MTPDDIQKAKALIKKHEGLKLKIYVDTTGHISFGYGHNGTEPISDSAALLILDDDVRYFQEKLPIVLPWFSDLDVNRQIALIDMAFNLGVNGLLEFKQMLMAMEEKNWDLAVSCMLSSRWATQVGQRSQDIAEIIRTGIIHCNLWVDANIAKTISRQ